jgi:hypothetical protein
MNQNQDFSALRNLLALRKLEMPLDTQVDRFLIELHRRQRAQLLVPESAWDRTVAWLSAKVENFGLFPSLSYAAAAAAIALASFVGLSQQVSVTHEAGGSYQLSLRLPTGDSSFAMLPVSFTPTSGAAKIDSLSFTPVHADAATPRFILANNSHAAYDANAAF